MIYTNKKYRYSLELPDGWRRRKGIPSFPVRGSTSAYRSPGDEASISVSIGLFEFDDFRDLHDHMLRRLAMEQFFKDEHGVLALEAEDFTLDGEENTLCYLYTRLDGSGRVISSFHNCVGYVIHTKDRTRCENRDVIGEMLGYHVPVKDDHWRTLEKILASFLFGTAEVK